VPYLEDGSGTTDKAVQYGFNELRIGGSIPGRDRGTR
jgi:hypothetical protein